jgi:serine/threonine protein kinase
MTIDLCCDDSLAIILSDEEHDPRYGSIVDHLSQCVRCQQRLDDLAAQPSLWKNARRFLSDPAIAFDVELPDCQTLVTAQLDTVPVEVPTDVRAFLESPRHPEMLGRIGKYEIEREIGRGGMGIVLKGFDSELNRPVAIKLLAPHLASSGTARQRFIREARAAAAVVHENVIVIHGIQTDSKLPSIVMPYIAGPSLQQFIDANGPLEAIDVVRVGIQIAAGLSAAHDQGLVHRDIKPANIILENGINRVQITDFGLARAAHDVDITRTGVIAGTPAFMSPEQSLSESIDHRSDLFSLGSVLYYAATGRLPFRASTPIGVLQQVCNGTQERPCDVESRIPPHLESVIEKLLAKSPDDRFADARELRLWLTKYLAHLQQPGTSVAPRRLVTPSSRKRGRDLLKRISVIAAVSVLGLFALLWWRVESVSQPFEASIRPSMPAAPTAADLVEAVAAATSGEAIDSEIRAVDQETSLLEVSADTGPLLPELDMLSTQLHEIAMEITVLETSLEQDTDVTPTMQFEQDWDIDSLKQELEQLESSAAEE